jgi:TolB-like protein/tetratricopeptide (TPR) repeat protein
MSDSLPKAVFLSNAREDGEAARRLADALRAFGVEVWFDRSELRGGDAWDQQIRRQIKECALFMPIISAQSDQRGEGYFRLEWKLAVERTHLLADGVPFLFPVVVDDTSETEASVPEQFLKAQWTRLPGGEPTPQFVEHVKRLLSGPRRPARQATSSKPTSAPVPAAPSPAPGFPRWAAALLGLAVIGLGTFVIFRPSAPPAAPKPAAGSLPAPPAVSASPPAAPAAAPASEKSLAVLPFSNMSEEKDTFFTDGMQEDILTNLALIPELRVVSRTSVMQYRGTTKTIRQIAQELGVTYVLEGSVRRAGNKVRVTGQLIKAGTDEHVWAKAFDREISDIFALQTELATEIAGALKTALTPQQKTIIAGRSTANIDAYSAYLKARDIRLWSDVTRVTRPEIDRLLQTAVQQDPNFVPAWLEIARVNFATYNAASFGGERTHLDAANAALAQAIRLAPNDPAVLLGQGQAAMVANDFAAARRFLDQALRLAPNDAEILVAFGRLASQERLWAEAMGYCRRALTLDPRNPVVVWDSYNALLNLRQFEQAAAQARLLLELQPDSFEAAQALAVLPFLARGDRTAMEAMFAGLTPAQHQTPKVIAAKFQWYYHFVGDAQAYVDLANQQGTDVNFNDDDSMLQYTEALIVLGQRERAVALARPVAERLKARSAVEPDNINVLTSLSYAQGISGDVEGATATLERILATVTPQLSLRQQIYRQANAAIVYGWVGKKDKAVDLVESMMHIPTAAFNSVHGMRDDIDYYPLRGFPRWEAMLAKPEYSKPFPY